MSLLNQDSPEELDDAARGEELTKGSSHVVWAGLIATVLVSAAIALYVWHGQKPPVAAGEIVQVWSHNRHTETSGVDANGDPMAKERFDEVLVFARVKLHNQSEQPLFLANALTNVTLDDGIHSSYAAAASDYERVFQAYPGISALHGKPLPTETTLNPGKTLDGDVISVFRLSKQQWDARKDLNFTFAFRYQPDLVLSAHSAVIEQ